MSSRSSSYDSNHCKDKRSRSVSVSPKRKLKHKRYQEDEIDWIEASPKKEKYEWVEASSVEPSAVEPSRKSSKRKHKSKHKSKRTAHSNSDDEVNEIVSEQTSKWQNDDSPQERVAIKSEPLDRDNEPYEYNRVQTIKQEHDKKDDSRKTSSTKNKDEKEKPNFELSGKLTEETNMFRGVVIKYNEPPEARKPKKKWRLYPFKGNEAMKCMHLCRQSAYLLGRDRKIADIPVDHPSCSKQHAVFQYRLVTYKRTDGRKGRRVTPYIIDLESANGTFVNNQKIETKRFVELREKDVIKFGFSSRDYVLLHDGSFTEDDQGED